jgi:hypothetical protein
VSESKYAKYVIDRDLMPPEPEAMTRAMEEQSKAGRTLDRTLLLGIQDSILKAPFSSAAKSSGG